MVTTPGDNDYDRVTVTTPGDNDYDCVMVTTTPGDGGCPCDGDNPPCDGDYPV